MMKHFKSELGIHMVTYIMRYKLEEAKSLLSFVWRVSPSEIGG